MAPKWIGLASDSGWRRALLGVPWHSHLRKTRQWIESCSASLGWPAGPEGRSARASSTRALVSWVLDVVLGSVISTFGLLPRLEMCSHRAAKATGKEILLQLQNCGWKPAIRMPGCRPRRVESLFRSWPDHRSRWEGLRQFLGRKATGQDRPPGREKTGALAPGEGPPFHV